MDFTIYQEKKCTLKCSTKDYSGSSEASTLFQLRCTHTHTHTPNHSHVNDHCNEKQFTCKKIMPNQLFFSFFYSFIKFNLVLEFKTFCLYIYIYKLKFQIKLYKNCFEMVRLTYELKKPWSTNKNMI